MNWSLWAAGAFDYGADKIGLTWGAVADLNQKNWALRTGYFLVPSESNGANFDMNIPARGSYVVEYERRFEVFGRAGKLRTIGWINSTFSGSYSETLDNPALALDITQTRNDSASNTATPSISSSRSLTMSGCSVAGAGTTGRARSWPSPISTRAYRSGSVDQGPALQEPSR